MENQMLPSYPCLSVIPDTDDASSAPKQHKTANKKDSFISLDAMNTRY